MEDENRRLHEADVAFVIVFVGNQQVERQPKIGAPCHIDRRSERSFEHDRGMRTRRNTLRHLAHGYSD